MASVSVNILEAVPAAGKTKAILKHIATNKRPAVVASISCQLSQQSHDYYVSIGGKDCAIVDSDHITRQESVIDIISETIGLRRVIFITHAALLRYPDYSDFSEYDLYIDEVPDLVEMNEIRFTDNMDLVSKYCKIEEGIMELLPEHRSKMEKMATDGMFGVDAVSERLFKLSRALLHGSPVSVNDNTARFVDDATTQNWGAFKTITIACANFDDTLTGVVLREYCHWDIKKSKLHSKLDFHEYRNTGRIEIVPLSHANWSRYAADNKVVDGITMYNKARSVVYDLTGNIPYIYTTNSYRSPFSTGQQVSYNPHGLNSYMAYTTAVALYSYNPLPWQSKMLGSMSGSLGDKLVQAFIVSKYLEPVFQLCLRTDIRNNNSDSKVTLIVPDLRAAEYLKSRYLKSANIDMSYCIDMLCDKPKKPRKKRVGVTFERKKETEPRKKRHNVTNIFELDSAEQRKFYRYQEKLGRKIDPNSTEDLLMVSEWLSTIR